MSPCLRWTLENSPSSALEGNLYFEVLFGEQFSFYFILWVCAVGVSHCNTIQLKHPSACELMFPLVWIGSSLSNHQASSIYCKLFWRSFRQHRSSVIRCEWGSCSAFSYFVYIYICLYTYMYMYVCVYIYIYIQVLGSKRQAPKLRMHQAAQACNWLPHHRISSIRRLKYLLGNKGGLCSP